MLEEEENQPCVTMDDIRLDGFSSIRNFITDAAVDGFPHRFLTSLDLCFSSSLHDATSSTRYDWSSNNRTQPCLPTLSPTPSQLPPSRRSNSHCWPFVGVRKILRCYLRLTQIIVISFHLQRATLSFDLLCQHAYSSDETSEDYLHESSLDLGESVLFNPPLSRDAFHSHGSMNSVEVRRRSRSHPVPSPLSTTTTVAAAHGMRLDFPVSKLFCLGSPLGLFVLLRKWRISLPRDYEGDSSEYEAVDNQRPNDGAEIIQRPALKCLYNLVGAFIFCLILID